MIAPDPRTLAGAITDVIVSGTRPSGLRKIGRVVEGAQDTASVWMTFEGRTFQVHVTELHPTELELAQHVKV